MRSVTIPRGTILLVAAMLLIPFTVSAQEVYYPPATDAAREVKSLFDITTLIGVLVFLITQIALFYTIWRFRKNRTVPTGEVHRGHTAAEITWTVIPALILIFLGVLAVSTLQTIEVVPAQSAESDDVVDVRVEGYRFGWFFFYPEEYGGGRDDTLNVVEGQKVRLTITSQDNQHALWIPAFALKVDAYPNIENVAYFTAPEPGEYFIQCAEYCGEGHHGMHANVIVYEEGEHEGRPVTMIEEEGPDVPPGPEATTALLEAPGEETSPWSMDPPRLEITLANESEGIHIEAPNAEENQGPHNLTVAGLVYTPGSAYAPGESKWVNFTLEDIGGPGEYQYWCAVPGHRGLGMEGTLVIRVEGE